MDKDNTKRTDRSDSSLAEDILIWRQQLIRQVLRVMLIFGGLMVAAGSYSTYSRGILWAMGVYIGVYVIVVFLALWRETPYKLQVVGIQLILYTLSVVVFITRGLGDSSRVYLLTMVFISVLFLGERAALLTIGIVVITMVGMGWAFTSGRLIPVEVVSTDLSAWIPLSLEVLSMGIFIMLLLSSYTARFNTYVTRSRELARSLEENQATLEPQVARRPADLERRSRQLETATTVAREATAIQNVETLLQRTVQLISDYFGFYHTGIFLIDPAGEYAMLRAASSEAGQRLLARGYHLKVGEEGVVGYVTQQGAPRIAQDMGADAVYDNPEMPATRSEMALPLQVRGKIIGALDVQSVASQAFTQEDVNVLQALADQLAVAIENTRLVAESQAMLAAAQRAYGEIGRVAWQEMFRARGELAARYDPHNLLSLDAAHPDTAKPHAPQSPSEVVAPPQMLAVPLKSRGQVIGELAAYIPAVQPWTTDQRELLETLAEQLGVALESARLYQDTQRRAAREQVTREITDALQRAVNMEALMRIATEELNRTLRGSHAYVRLNLGETQSDDPAASQQPQPASETPPLKPGDGDYE